MSVRARTQPRRPASVLFKTHFGGNPVHFHHDGGVGNAMAAQLLIRQSGRSTITSTTYKSPRSVAACSVDDDYTDEMFSLAAGARFDDVNQGGMRSRATFSDKGVEGPCPHPPLARTALISAPAAGMLDKWDKITTVLFSPRYSSGTKSHDELVRFARRDDTRLLLFGTGLLFGSDGTSSKIEDILSKHGYDQAAAQAKSPNIYNALLEIQFGCAWRAIHPHHVVCGFADMQQDVKDMLVCVWDRGFRTMGGKAGYITYVKECGVIDIDDWQEEFIDIEYYKDRTIRGGVGSVLGAILVNMYRFHPDWFTASRGRLQTNVRPNGYVNYYVSKWSGGNTWRINVAADHTEDAHAFIASTLYTLIGG